MLAGVDVVSRRSVLDVGCGSGRVTREIARRTPQGCVLGVDFSPAMVEYARQNYVLENLAFRQDDAADLRVDARFDLITSFACLHWLKDPARAAARMVRERLHPNGLLRVQMGGAGNMGPFIQGVERLRQTPRWQKVFAGFDFPWSFWSLEPYEKALQGMRIERLELIERTKTLESRDDFKRWFEAGWRPYVDRLGPHLDEFLEELLAEHQGRIELPMVRVDLAVRG